MYVVCSLDPTVLDSVWSFSFVRFEVVGGEHVIKKCMYSTFGVGGVGPVLL